MKRARGRKAPYGETGFTLVEVLIAVLVIAIGLLGLAGLQATGIGSSYISSVRSIASIHAENMAEMMRANIVGVNANAYGTIDYGAIDPDTAPNPDCRDPDEPCTPNEQAQADAFHWISAVSRDLPVDDDQVAGVVVCEDRDDTDGDDCSNGSAHTITVTWQEKDLETANMQQKSFSTVFSP